MALDLQQNWNISMAENLERTMRLTNHERIDSRTMKNEDCIAQTTSNNANDDRRDPVHLPDEIIIHILDYVHHQSTLATCAKLSRQWFAIATPLLYRAPTLYGHNYDPFVRAICPSVNQHVRPSPLSTLVKVLDMRHLVHQGSKSMTARLLGRTKGNLEEFCAPQASFAINCLPALGKCAQLRVLDLTLVSESPGLLELFKTTAGLRNLKTLRLPRSSGFGVQQKASAFPAMAWPPALEDLCLSGGIDAHFLHGVVSFPQTLRSLTLEHCPNAKGYAVTHLLKTAVRPLQQLEALKIAHMPRLSSHALDDVLHLLPQLKKLSVSIDYVTPALFDEGRLAPPVLPEETEDALDLPAPALSHNNLRTLELTYSGAQFDVEDKITAVDIMIAIDEGALPALRQVRVDQRLHWQGANTKDDVGALTDVLQDGARNDWEAREWLFADSKSRVSEDASAWKTVSGVWIFYDG
jgi:hypothetical protein